MNESEKLFQRALNKAADILARRNHSEKELREKMGKFFEPDLIDKVIQEAWERHWLLPPEELAKNAAKSWSRSNKSARYIREQLKKRGLPPVEADEEEELQKMRTLLMKKFRLTDLENLQLDYDERVKAFRYLRYRGFSDGLIRKVIHEQL